MMKTYYCKECYYDFIDENSDIVDEFFLICDFYSINNVPLAISKTPFKNWGKISKWEYLERGFEYVVTHETNDHWMVKPLGYSLTMSGEPKYCLGNHLNDIEDQIPDA